MDGLRVSGNLALMEVADRSYAGKRLSRMLGELAKAGVNMNLFIGGETQEEIRFACCVAASDGAHIKALMDPNPELRTGVELSAAVDLLALFPHCFDLKILGLESPLCQSGDSFARLLLFLVRDHVRHRPHRFGSGHCRTEGIFRTWSRDILISLQTDVPSPFG